MLLTIKHVLYNYENIKFKQSHKLLVIFKKICSPKLLVIYLFFVVRNY
jgi:hypothetical protein